MLTNAVRYLDPQDARIADVLDSARRLVPLNSRHIDADNGEAYLKDARAMADLADEIAIAPYLHVYGRNAFDPTDAAVIATRRILMRAAHALEGGEEPYAATHGDCYRDRAWSGVLPRNDDFLNDPAAQQMMLSEVP